MAVRISYFAAARELCGISEEDFIIAQPLSGESLLTLIAERHPRIAPYLSRMRVALNGEFASTACTVHDGDELALLPPVAGGNSRATLRRAPLSVDEAIASVSHPSAGGIAVFVGVVRDHADGREVARLDYEAHDALAIREMERILAQLLEEFPSARIVVQHRVGELRVGDPAVIVAASAPHRAQAFDACRAAIDRIKETVPIWKKEWAADGSALWVNLDAPNP